MGLAAKGTEKDNSEIWETNRKSKLKTNPNNTPLCLVCESDIFLNFHYHHFDFFKCKECGLVTTLPYPSAAQIEKHYSDKFINGNYKLLRQHTQSYVNGVYRGFVERIRYELKKRSADITNIKVLDVGCFTADFIELLSLEGADVYGVELQDQAVEIASKKLPGRIFKTDVFGSDWPLAQYDVVTLLGVLEHVLEPIKLLERSKELLKPGGLLLIQTPNSGSVFAKSMGSLWPPYEPVEHIHLFSEHALKLALRKVGFVDTVSKRHWKKLPIEYVYNMFQNFGTEFYSWLKPFYTLLPDALRKKALPVYAGEMLVSCIKRKTKD